MVKLWLNKKTKKLYSWKASKNCVCVDDENDEDRKQLFELGLLRPAD